MEWDGRGVKNSCITSTFKHASAPCGEGVDGRREGGKDGSRRTCRGNTTPVCAAGTCQSSPPCRRVGTRGRHPAVEMNLMSQSRTNSLNSGFISRA